MSDVIGLPADGVAAPPRLNGELAFDEPWELRAVGMAVALVEAGVFGWDDFRERLIARIAQWEALADSTRPPWRYYDHFVGALEELAAQRAAVTGGELDARAMQYAERPAGHDH